MAWTPDSLLAAANIRTLPVDLRALAQFLGLSLHYTSLLPGKVDAAYYPELKAIAINSRKPKVRQRFSIAHEIAECALGAQQSRTHVVRLSSSEVQTSGSSPERQKQCNRFAGRILVPEIFLTRHLMGSMGYSITRLAGRFQVSQDCLRLRLLECCTARKAACQPSTCTPRCFRP